MIGALSHERVAVIGAGPCGLPVCKALAQAGLDYQCFEAADAVGGVWNLSPEGSGAYRSLHTNTSTKAMAYSDYPFDVPEHRHLPAEELRDYFERYATHFDLRPHIRFGTRVVRASPLDDGGWELELEGGERRRFGALVVASGQYACPRWPTEPRPEDFAGDSLHVFDYFDPATPVDCRGKRVVVVGLGSSAAELAAELSDPDHPIGTAASVHLAARSGRWVVNKLAGGKPIDVQAPHPADPLPPPIRWLPPAAATWAMRRVMKLGIQRLAEQGGSAQELGLPVPEIEPWAERPTMSNEFIPAVREGRVKVHPGIARFQAHRVFFADGEHVEADVVLYATGYRLDLPFLDRETLGCDAPDLSLYQRIAHPEHERLFFVGFLRVGCSMWPVAEQQALWIAKALGGGFAPLTGRARRDAATPLMRTMPVMCNVYVDGLRREAGGL